jgi:hypothetical protein
MLIFMINILPSPGNDGMLAAGQGIEKEQRS